MQTRRPGRKGANHDKLARLHQKNNSVTVHNARRAAGSPHQAEPAEVDVS